MQNTVKQFLNETFGQVRALEENGVIWFVAKDICLALGYSESNISHVVERLDNEVKTTRTLTTSGSKYTTQALFVNEDGLYDIVMGATRKPKAKPFRKWITSTVIPALRKDGMYVDGEEKVSTGEMSEDELVLKAMTMLQAKVERLQKERDEYKQTTDQFMSTTNLLEWDTVCKNLNVGRNTMLKKLRDIKVLQTDQYEYNGRTYYGESHNVPYQQYMKYFDVKYLIKNGKRYPKVLVTAKGQEYLHKKLLQQEV